MCVQFIQFLPVNGEGIGPDAFGMIQAKEVNGAFYGIQIDLPVIIRQMKLARMRAGDD